MAQNLKLQKREVDSLTEKMKESVSLNEAFRLVEEVLRIIAIFLQSIQVWPAVGLLFRRFLIYEP